MESVFIFLTVFSVAVVLPLALVKLILDYRKTRHLHGSTDDSLAMSELREMIEDSVEKSTKPLLRRVAHLEKQLAQLPPAQNLEPEISDALEVDSD